MADRISNLPDSILHHILSLMPTKQVVKTSVLSKRWVDLWTSAPNIDFDDLSMGLPVDEIDDVIRLTRVQYKYISFRKFAERVLILRGQSSLKRFWLVSEGRADCTQIYSWISGAIAHNVQELELMLQDSSAVPWSLLNRSTSLVSLSIHFSTGVEVGELPCDISFPCLKSLFLRLFEFPNGNSMQKLLTGCPVLEKVFLVNVVAKGAGKFIVSSSSLKSLRIDNWNYYGRVTIDAANLKSFHYNGILSGKIIFLSNASSLAEASVHIETPEKRKKQNASRVVDLLKDLKDTVSLSLCDWTIESLKFADNMQAVSFPNLIRVTLDTTDIKNYTFGALVDLLSLCPVLESICFPEGLNLETQPDWSSIPIPIPCMKSCLKRLRLEKFRGYKSEMCFLKWVLKNACVLERMDIWRSETYGNNLKKKKTKAMVELLKADRSSATCVIKFF